MFERKYIFWSFLLLFWLFFKFWLLRNSISFLFCTGFPSISPLTILLFLTFPFFKCIFSQDNIQGPFSSILHHSFCKHIQSEALTITTFFFFFLDDYQIILFSINTFPEINSHIPICLLGNLKTYFSEPNLQCSLSHHQLHLLTPLFINATTASQVTQTHLWVSPPSGDSAFINAINYQDSITEDKVTEREFSSPIITNPKFTTLLRNKKGTPAIT